MPSASAKPDTAAEFVRLGPDGSAAAAPHQVVTVPGETVPLFALDLPARLHGQAREQVARRQLAARLGLRSDQFSMQPFAPARKTAAAWTRVLAADTGWLDSLRRLPGRAVLPDYLALPAAAGVWSLALRGSGPGAAISVRLGVEDGFTAQAPLALVMLQQALDSTPRPKVLLLPQDAPPEFAELARIRDIPVAASPAAVAALGLPQPVVLGHGELACDLRRNPMAAQAQLERKLRPWRWPLLAAVLAAALWSAAQITAIRRIEAQTAAAAAETTALAQTHFTNGAPVLDARLQISRALSGLRTAAGPAAQPDVLELTRRIAAVAAKAGARAESLSYQQGEAVRLAVRLADFAAADQLAAALRAQGLAVQLTDSRADGSEGGVFAEFAVTADSPDPDGERR